MPGIQRLPQQDYAALRAANVEARARTENQAGERGYVGVHNLHQDNRFASLFNRVQPTEAQVTKRLGEKALKYVSYDPDERGIPQVKLRLKAAADPSHVDEKTAKANASRVRKEYALVRQALSDTSAEFDAQVAQNQAQERHRELADQPLFKRWFNKIGDIFRGAPPPANLDLRFVAAEDGSNQGRLLVGANDEAGQRQMREGLVEGAPARRQAPGNFNPKEAGSRARWTAVGVGAAALGAGGAVAGALLLTGVAVSGAIVGGGLLAAGVLGKALFGKYPWWGKTVQGQLQYAERQQARDMAADVAKSVKAQVLRSAEAAPNVAVPQGQLQKRYLADDPNMISDFVRLARAKNHDQLKAAVREKLLQADSSFLSPETIAATKLGFFKGRMFGNERGHANKTVDIAVREIVRGIEQGVAEGTLQTVVGELADAASVQSQNKIVEVAKRRLDDFQHAVQILNPAQEGASHDIFEVDRYAGRLQALKAEVKADRQALNPTEAAIIRLRAANDEVGADNVASYSTALRQLDGDIDAHLDSLQDVKRLLHRPAQPPIQAQGQDEGTPNLQDLNADLAAALDDVLQADPAAVKARYDALKGQLQQLRHMAASQEATPALIQAHADKLKALFDAEARVVDSAERVSNTLASAHAAFGKDGLMMAQVAQQVSALEAKADAHLVNMDPTNEKAIPAALDRAQAELDRLAKLGQDLQRASGSAQDLSAMAQKIRQQVARGQLKEALNGEAIRDFASKIESQRQDIQAWADAGFKKPQDLKAYSDADLKQLRIDMTADALGLDEAQRTELRPALEQLLKAQAEVPSLVTTLQALQPDQRLALLRAVKPYMPPAALAADASAEQVRQNAEQAQDAAIACHAAALATGVQLGGQGTGLMPLLQALHPNQTALLQKRQQAVDAQGALARGMQSDAGQKLMEWVQAKGLLPDVPLRRDVQAPQGFDAARSVAALAAFITQQEGLPQKAEMLAALQDARALWSEPEAEGQAQGAGPKGLLERQDLATQRAGLNAASYEHLRTVQGMFEALGEPISSAVEQLREAQRQAQLQALALQEQAKLELAGPNAKDPQALKVAAQEAAQAKDGRQAELDSVAQDLRAGLAQSDALQGQQDVEQLRLRDLADALKQLIGSKDSTEVLMRRVSEQPELRAQLAALIYAHNAINGAEVPEVFNSAIDGPTQLNAAKAVAAYKKLSGPEQESLAQALGDEWAPLKQRLDERQAMGAKLIKPADGQLKSDRDIRKALARDEALGAFVNRHHDEDLAYAALWKAAGQPDQDARHVRTLVEGAASQQENAMVAGSLTRAQVLNEAHAGAVLQRAQQTLVTREQALTGLQTMLQNKYGATGLAYLQEQLDVVREARSRLPDDARAALKAFQEPQGGSLASLGAVLRECQPFEGKSRVQIQNAYLGEQVQRSRKALKWFDLKHFSQTKGLFSKMLFVLGQKQQRLNRVLSDASPQRALDIARVMTQIARGAALGDALTEAARAQQLLIDKLKSERDALVNNRGHVDTALRLVAAQHLASKQGQGQLAPTLNQADIEVVLQQWQALVGENGAAAFPDVERVARQGLLGRGATQLLQSVNPQQAEQVAAQLAKLQQTDELARAGFVALRERVNAAEVNKADGAERANKLLLTKAGVDPSPANAQAFATALDRMRQNSGTEGAARMEQHLTEWALLQQDITGGADPRSVVLRATQLKADMQADADELRANRSENGPAAIEQLLAELEFALLERMGAAAPVALPSTNTSDFRAAQGLVLDLRAALRTDDSASAAPARLQSFNSHYSSQLPEPDEDFGTLAAEANAPGLARAEAGVMSLWADASAGLMRMGNAPQEPAQWQLMNRLAEARFHLGQACLQLAEALGQQKDQSEAEATEKARSKKGRDQKAVTLAKERAASLQATQDRLRARASAHLHAAAVAAVALAQNVRNWAGEGADDVKLPTFTAWLLRRSDDSWKRNIGQATGLPRPVEAQPETWAGVWSPDTVKKGLDLDMAAFADPRLALQVTTDQMARGLDRKLMGGMIEAPVMMEAPAKKRGFLNRLFGRE